jgi:hypothetical protein
MPLGKKRLGHPKCPQCAMGMIVTAGYGLALEQKTCECLQCGYLGKPAKPAQAEVAE